MTSVDPDLLAALVEKGVSRGASYVEARYHRISSLSAYIVNGEPVSVSPGLEEGVAVRVVAGGGLGFAATNRLDRESLEAALERAVVAARAAGAHVQRPVEMGEARLGRARYSVIEKRPLDGYSVDEKLSMLVEAYKQMPLGEARVQVPAVNIFYRETREEKMLVTSDGARVESVTPRVFVYYNITAKNGSSRANRWSDIGGSGGLEVLEENGLAEKLVDDLASLETALVKAGPPPRGRMDVVLGTEIVGLSVHESTGHPGEADRVLGREAAQAGLSFRSWYGDDVIGSELVTVIDDPTIPGSYGFYLYDDEGVAARPRYMVREGRFGEMLHNRETGAVYGVESNGAARAAGYWAEPIVRMANTYMAPGDYRFEELVEDIGEGVYLKKYMEWNIDDERWGQRYVALEAYRIRNGRLGEPLRDVAVEFTTPEYYRGIDAVGRDLEFHAGTCGKGEPGQGVPVWFGGPHVRVRNVKVG